MDYYRMRDELNHYDFYQILAVGVPQVKFYQFRDHYIALCPFHKDTHLGSFSFNATTGIWKCFSCGKGGHGAINFVMEVNGWSFKETIRFLWEHRNDPVSVWGDPPASLFRKQKNKRWSNYQSLKNATQSISLRNPPPYQADLPGDELDLIYRAFAASSPLSEREKEKLCEIRGLKIDAAEQFFRFPSAANRQFWNTFRQALGANGRYNKLLGVPGFYWDQYKGEISFIGQRNALGILNHDLQGRVNGIELRLKSPQSDSKYIPFSSANRPYGTKQRSWVDFVPASQGDSIGLAVTEGKYKALHLSYAGYDVLNIHGVGNWKEVVDILNNEDINVPIYIAFDADARKKASVAVQAMKFGEALLAAEYEAQYLVWPEEHGKGFDDLCNAGFSYEAIPVPAKEYLEKELRPVAAKVAS